MTATSALVKSAVATSAAVLLVAHREAVGEVVRGDGERSGAAGCPVLRALGRVPAQGGAPGPDAALAYPDYGV